MQYKYFSELVNGKEFEEIRSSLLCRDTIMPNDSVAMGLKKIKNEIKEITSKLKARELDLFNYKQDCDNIIKFLNQTINKINTRKIVINTYKKDKKLKKAVDSVNKKSAKKFKSMIKKEATELFNINGDK